MSDPKKPSGKPSTGTHVPNNLIPNQADFAMADRIVSVLPAGAILIIGRSTVVVVPDWVTSHMLILSGIHVPGGANQRFIPQFVVHNGIRIVSAKSILMDLQRAGYAMFDLNCIKANLDELNAVGGKGNVMRLGLKAKL